MFISTLMLVVGLVILLYLVQQFKCSE